LTLALAAQIEPIPFRGQQEAIRRALAEFVERSGLSPGEQLPTERALMQSLRVGRSTIREALRHWQALGIVEVRKGSGTYLKRRVKGSTIHLPLSIEAERDGLLQTIEVRRGLETEAGALAALRATPEDLEAIEQKLVAMEAAFNDHGTAGPQDLAFHLSIYDASRNPLFGQLLSQIRDGFALLFSQPFDRADFAARSFPFHRMLFEAIGSRDADAARRHTLAILTIAEEDVIRMAHE
jgi:GntR family transcriptional regulator, transcriptional repressor for pyruvate dehydrogenase complex